MRGRRRFGRRPLASGEEDSLCPRLSDWALSLVSPPSAEEGMQGMDEAGASLRGAGVG